MKAIKAGALIDGNGGVSNDPVILVDGGRIKQVGAAADVHIPDGAEVIDAGRCTLMPGMMDLHIHLCMFNNRTFNNYRVAQWEISPELQQMYALFHAQLCMEMGFTTLRDLGLASTRGLLTNEMCAVRDSIDAGIFPGPAPAGGRIHLHHRLPPGARAAACGAASRLPERGRTVGAAKARTHQSSRGL